MRDRSEQHDCIGKPNAKNGNDKVPSSYLQVCANAVLNEHYFGLVLHQHTFSITQLYMSTKLFYFTKICIMFEFQASMCELWRLQVEIKQEKCVRENNLTLILRVRANYEKEQLIKNALHCISHLTIDQNGNHFS